MGPAGPIPPVRAALFRRLYECAQAGRWGLSEDEFSGALANSAAHRFRTGWPAAREVEEYLGSLHLEDLALACGCARGRDSAWEHFVREFRPALLAAAAASAPPDIARDIADSLYAELFGLEERDGVRRSLFDYFHGRSTLSGWLRAVVAQRVVDWARTARRLEPLPDAELPAPPAAGPEPEVRRQQARVRAALAGAVAALDARDRLRLTLYYTQQLKLAAIGRMIGESEATTSRRLERTRKDLRAAIERRLRDAHLSDAEIAACFDHARTDPAFDLARVLPPPHASNAGRE